jgi:hypothetical protein
MQLPGVTSLSWAGVTWTTLVSGVKSTVADPVRVLSWIVLPDTDSTRPST